MQLGVGTVSMGDVMRALASGLGSVAGLELSGSAAGDSGYGRDVCHPTRPPPVLTLAPSLVRSPRRRLVTTLPSAPRRGRA